MSVLDVKDRIPTNVLSNSAVRYGVYDEEGKLLRYEYMKREDEPLEEGTPINKLLLDNFQGDLYTQDRYNITNVTYELITENISIEGNIFPKQWSTVTDQTSYIADDGTKLTSSGSRGGDTYSPTNAFDRYTSTSWGQTITGSEGWLKIEFTAPKKITHMSTHTFFNGTGGFTMKIQGSNDDQTWADLFSTSNVYSSITEISLNNVDFYKFYRMYWMANGTSSATIAVYEWQVSKYIDNFYSYVNEIDLPLSSYEKGKIVNIEGGRMPTIVEETVDSDIIPKVWTKVTSTEYVATDGTKLTASGAYSDNVPNACDNNTETEWSVTAYGGTSNWIQLEFPQPTKISEMYLKIYIDDNFSSSVLQGSNDNEEWITLHTLSTGEAINIQTNIILETQGYYKYYRVYSTAEKTTSGPRFYEWQVTQWKRNVETYITSFENPYLNINNLGNKQINGTINYGEKYSLVYNGESWDVVNTRIVTGSFTGTQNTSYNIYVGFTPDLVICYSSSNNIKGVGDGSGSPSYKYIPRILTKAYKSSSDGAIIENGFSYMLGAGADIYYIAIKF